MKHLFIINPAAGSCDRTESYTRQIEASCGKRGLDYRIEVSAAPGECARLAREAAQTGEEIRIYACGGDGTLNEVASGAAGYPNAAVAVLSGGSGNDFVRIFNEPEAFFDLERLLDAEEVERIRGAKIAIVDDVISTGSSLAALEYLVEKAGGTVVAKAAILAEGDAADRPDILYLEKIPLFFK